jgi:N-acylneuraminate cytidylyltransferase
VVLLQVTSPFRSGNHLGEAWERYRSNRADMLLSVCSSKQNPYYNLFEEQNGYLQKSKEGTFTRRQDCPAVWELNGAIYIFRTDRFLEVGMEGMHKIKYEMSEHDSIDLDTPLDWIVAEHLLIAQQR